jgi:hypothetical protein
METRAVIEVKIYLLHLNPMQERIEAGRVVAISPSIEALMSFYKGEETAPYQEDGFNFLTQQDHVWNKHFKKGGPLEWYNPINIEGPEAINTWGHGIHMQWLPIDKIREFEGIIVDPNKELDTIKTGFSK